LGLWALVYIVRQWKVKNNMEKIIVFIDGSYIVKSADFKIDYKKLMIFLTKKLEGKIENTIYFNSAPKQITDSQEKFHNFLKSANPVGPGIEVEIYSLKSLDVNCRHCKKTHTRNVQNGVDVALATKMIEQAYLKNCTRIVLLAGDSDFVPSLNFLRNHLNQKITTVGFRNTMSVELQSISSDLIFLNEEKKNIERK